MWVCGCIALACLVVMVVLASQHKNRVIREAMAANLQEYVPPVNIANDNVTFTDRNYQENRAGQYQQNRVVV